MIFIHPGPRVLGWVLQPDHQLALFAFSCAASSKYLAKNTVVLNDTAIATVPDPKNDGKPVVSREKCKQPIAWVDYRAIIIQPYDCHYVVSHFYY